MGSVVDGASTLLSRKAPRRLLAACDISIALGWWKGKPIHQSITAEIVSALINVDPSPHRTSDPDVTQMTKAVPVPYSQTLRTGGRLPFTDIEMQGSANERP